MHERGLGRSATARMFQRPARLRGAARGRALAAIAISVAMVAATLAGVGAQPSAMARPASPAAAGAATVNAQLSQGFTKYATYGVYPPAWAYASLYPTSSPAVGDITGDGVPDVVWGRMDGYLSVYNAVTGAGEFDVKLSGPIQASPVLVDLYGTGRPQVLVSTASTDSGPGKSQVVVLSFTQSGYSYKFNQSSTHAPNTPSPNHEQPFFATPAYGDIDGDGKPEIVAVNQDRYLYAWHLDGTQAFAPKFLYDTVASSPVLVDWNHDGRDEIVFGGDSGPYPPYQYAKGLLWSIDGGGNVSPGFPIQIPDQVVWSTPTVTDLLGNGHDDVIFGSGMNYPGDGGSKVYAYDLTNQQPLPGFPAATWGRTYTNPVVADLNGNGHKDILVGTGRGWIYAFDQAGHEMWQQCTTRFTACTQNGQSGADFLQVKPVVADIDGDGALEAVVSTEQDIKVYDAATGAPENFTESGGTRNADVTVAGAYINAAAPTIAQVDSVASIYLVGLKPQGSGGPKAGDIGFLQRWTTSSALGAAPWPTFKANMNRRGYLPGTLDQLPALRSFVAATIQDFLGRDATSSEITTNANALAEGLTLRTGYLHTMVTSDAWIDSLLTKFYEDTFGRSPDTAGEAYWANLLRKGLQTPAQVAAHFYSSNEYYANAGNTDQGWMTDLYEALLGREPDTDGLNYWIGQSHAVGRTTVAYAFYQSVESSRKRVTDLYESLLKRDPDSAGLKYWASVLPAQGDLTLALLLAASDEYATKAITRYPPP